MATACESRWSSFQPWLSVCEAAHLGTKARAGSRLVPERVKQLERQLVVAQQPAIFDARPGCEATERSSDGRGAWRARRDG
jgi:hypothetical protein